MRKLTQAEIGHTFVYDGISYRILAVNADGVPTVEIADDQLRQAYNAMQETDSMLHRLGKRLATYDPAEQPDEWLDMHERLQKLLEEQTTEYIKLKGAQC